MQNSTPSANSCYLSIFLLCPIAFLSGARVHAADPCSIALTTHSGTTHIDEDIRKFQQRAKRATNSAPYIERLGWTSVAKARDSHDPGFYSLAEQCASCIESRDPNNAAALLLRGHVLHNQHRFREAEEIARTIADRRGRWFDYALLGDVLIEQGDLEDAHAAYQAMMDRRPGPRAFSRAAHLRWLTGDLQGAVRLMEKTARASDTRDREASAWVYDRLALYALQSVNLPEAKAFVDTSRTFKFDFSPALLTRGRLLLALGRPAKALDALREAATLNPLPEYHWILHDTLDVLGHRHEARTLHAQLMRNGAFDDPRTFSLYLSTTRQDISKALELDERELEDRADVFTLDSYAWALQVSGRRHEAREFSDRALARETRDARLFYHAEIIAGGLGNLESAESFLRKATHLEHMLFPSEQEQLAAAICQLANSERTEGGT